MLIALDTMIAEIRKFGNIPDQALATWLLPVFVHLQGKVAAPIPERVAELSRLVGVDLTGPEEA